MNDSQKDKKNEKKDTKEELKIKKKETKEKEKEKPKEPEKEKPKQTKKAAAAKDQEKTKEKPQPKEKPKDTKKVKKDEANKPSQMQQQQESESDPELKQISQKYKQNRTALKLKQKEDDIITKITKEEEVQIPIRKKEDPDLSSKWVQASNVIIKNPEPGQTSVTPQSSTAQVMQQTLALGIYEKSESGAYRIPQHLHKNYPHAIRLYVGNLPDIFDKEDFMNFVQKQMDQAGGLLEPGSPIVFVQLQLDKKFLFAQFRSIEETSAFIQLDGIMYNGKALRIRRVKDYDSMPKVEGERKVPKLTLQKLNIQKISTMVCDGPQKLYIAGFSPETDEEQLINILSQYGQLKSLHIVRDRATNVSKGYAFCEFTSEFESNNCMNLLNNRTINGRTFQVKKGISTLQLQAELSASSKPNAQPHVIDVINVLEQQEWDNKLAAVQKMKTSSVLRFTNMIRADEIEDDTEYFFVKKDIRRELEKVGKIVSMIVPRKKDKYPEGSVGRVYVEFENENYAIVAYMMVQGKKYDGRDLKVEFYEPHLYVDKVL